MVELEIEKAYPSDLAENIARIPRKVLLDNDLMEGDPVLIHGAKRTISVVKPLDVVDSDDSVRLDLCTRWNAGVELGETVSIESVEPKPAEYITVRIADSGGRHRRGNYN